MVWIAERKEWVGIRYKEGPSHFEGDYWGKEESLYVGGPFKLSEECAKLIRQAYVNPDFPLEEVLHTEPSALMKKAPK